MKSNTARVGDRGNSSIGKNAKFDTGDRMSALRALYWGCDPDPYAFMTSLASDPDPAIRDMAARMSHPPEWKDPAATPKR